MDFDLPDSRTAAKAAGESKYFTGKPCSKGHLSYRYTNSGTCSECINGGRTTGVLGQRVPKNPDDAQKLATLAGFVHIKEPVLPDDVPEARRLVWAFAVMHCPTLTESDVWPTRRQPEHGVLYRIDCHPNDAAALRSALQAIKAKNPASKPVRPDLSAYTPTASPIPKAFDF